MSIERYTPTKIADCCEMEPVQNGEYVLYEDVAGYISEEDLWDLFDEGKFFHRDAELIKSVLECRKGDQYHIDPYCVAYNLLEVLKRRRLKDIQGDKN